MPRSLLDSQLAILEPPEADEFGMHLDISRPVTDLLNDAVAVLARLPR
jgi:gluconokinase